MSTNTLQQVIVVLNVLVIVGLVACIGALGVLMSQQNASTKLLGDTKDLGQELRQSSDDLTRFIRVFTTTNNASYWDYFQQVIRIRDGIDPLPVDPWRNYWDLFIAEGVAPNGFTAPSAILDRMAQAEFTQDEFDLLAEAKAQSDALIDLEDVAYHAMIGRYRPSDTSGLSESEARAFSVSREPNQTLAIQLVHGVEYHHSKGNIMRPLDAAIAKANDRVDATAAFIFRLNVVVICLLALMLMLLLVVLGVYFGKVAREAQTQQLLSTVLPERVVSAVPVQRFSELKTAAATHAALVQGKQRRRHRLRGGGKRYENDSNATNAHMLLDGTDFPVLYAEFLSLAWVAFTDVVRFTDMCRYSSSRQVISTLNELFSLLDVEAANYGVEKIKTIGDAFMCAKLTTSGITQAEIGLGGTARDAAGDGSLMLQFLFRACDLANTVARPQPPTGLDRETSSEYGRGGTARGARAASPEAPVGGLNGSCEISEAVDLRRSTVLHLRSGLHVGPVASGIVGFERPLFDLFGDTVNTAARLEGSGTANCVHMMETTIAQLDGLPLHMLPDAQMVPLKGIGEVRTRLVTGIKGEGDTSESKGGSDTHSTRSCGSVERLKAGGGSGLMHVTSAHLDSPPTRPNANHPQQGMEMARLPPNQADPSFESE